MSNLIDIVIDVLASSPNEIQNIERALETPCEELIVWRTNRGIASGELAGVTMEEIATDTRQIVALKPIRNLGSVDPSVNKARRFGGECKDRYSGLFWSHVILVSRAYPNALFLAKYCDIMMSYTGKIVYRAGRELRAWHDGDHHAQGVDWVLPDIFAPFRTEYELGAECSSLWDVWLSGMRRALNVMAAEYGTGTTTQDQNAGLRETSDS